jgi:Outer membrane protein beta-barrel domain
MRIVPIVIFSAVLLAITPVSGSAQDQRFHFNIGGGPTFVMGDLADRFETGWGPAVGFTFDANPKLGFQFEYAYRWFAIPDEAEVGLLDANHQMHQLTFNLVANLTPPDSAIRAYIVAGPGSYYRKVEITRYAGTGVICDPYYYVCGAYPIENVLGSRGGWDFGFNVGGGIGFALGESGEFYIESRYHYVWGPEIVSSTPLPAGVTPPNGGKTNGQYLPLTFGFRF